MKFFWIFISVFVALLSCFLTPAHSLDIALAWDADSTVDGYKLYYKAGSSGPPYNGTGAVEGDSPVNVGWVSEFTLRALSDDDYYFVVTAYTQDGESGYSNEVTTGSGSVATNSGGGSSGDSGGGCFISTILRRPASTSN